MKALIITRSPSVMRPPTTPCGGAPQHRHQADGDDQLLAGVQQRQRGLALQAGAAQALQALVVAAGLEALVVEVLDGLVVQQRVHRLGVGGGIELVGLAAELRAPLGHRDREDDVQHQRRQRDPGEPGVELHGQDGQHQRHLDQRRHDAVERIRDQRLDAAHAALDVARHAAGLALQVEAQRQRMQVPEGLQRDAARRALRGLGEHQLAQLGEQRRRQPQQRHRPASSPTGTTSTALASPGLMSMASTRSLSSSGTPTLATLAATMKASAATTRHLYSHR